MKLCLSVKDSIGFSRVFVVIQLFHLFRAAWCNNDNNVACMDNTTVVPSPHVLYVKASDPDLVVDGSWGNWGAYGRCLGACNEGIMERRRYCNKPSPRNGGKPCKGNSVSQRFCDLARCVLRSVDTEFRRGSTGIWKNFEGTPGFYWKLGRGRTQPTGNTGPSQDASGDGYYIYADSSLPRRTENIAKLISDMFTPAPKVNRVCLKFHYHMFGPGMGLLSVRIRRNYKAEKQILSLYGNQGNEWIRGRVTLKSSVPYQVVFAAAVGTPGLSDIALDNIYLDPGPCKCQDRYQNCSHWAETGHCVATYFWMAKYCKKSCGTCYCENRYSNDSRYCEGWARDGFCAVYTRWMSTYCRLGCGLCDCDDFFEFKECKTRVKAGECESNMSWMAQHCKLSCGFCDCKNVFNYIQCETWSKAGECERNPIFMSSSCQLSCGLCNCRNIVSREQCDKWSKMGACERHPVYMSSNCQQSCGFCYCKNTYEKCTEWASNGECSKNPEWMSVFCTLACGKCQCHDKSAECKSWVEKGQCEINPSYMNAYCQKSCGKC